MQTNDNMHFFHQHQDLIRAGIAGVSYTAITLTNIDLAVKIVAGLLTCFYMGYKLFKEVKNK